MPQGPYCAITGDGRLRANLDWLDRYFGTEAMAVTLAEQQAVAEDIAAEARRLAPVRTGRLKSEIIVVKGKESTEIVSGAPYSLFIEFGTSHNAAQPFLRPAFHAFGYFRRVAAKHEENLEKGLT